MVTVSEQDTMLRSSTHVTVWTHYPLFNSDAKLPQATTSC